MDLAGAVEFLKVIGSVFSLINLINKGDLTGSLDGAQLSM